MKILTTLSLLLLLCLSSFVSAQDAEFIWAEDDYSGSQIYLSQHKNGVWQPAQKIIDDHNLNILPTLGGNSKNQRLAVWSTVDNKAKSVLKFSIRNGNHWTVPQILTDQMPTNLAPVAVFDANDIGWVFWSANNGEDDDIYVSKYEQGIWSNPEMVNDENNTPDILPEAGLDNNGNIWVSWQQLQDNGYVDITRSYETKSQSKMLTSNAITMQSVTQIKSRSNLDNNIQPPKMFKGRSRATMYFPTNKTRPSKPVKGYLH